jgi:hypothetical protein
MKMTGKLALSLFRIAHGFSISSRASKRKLTEELIVVVERPWKVSAKLNHTGSRLNS